MFVQILARRQEQANITIPAVPEALIVWILSGEADVEERPPGGEWLANRVVAGDFFLTTATTPTEMRWKAEPGTPFTVMHVYIGVSMMQNIAMREVSGERDETLSALLEHIRAEMIEQHPASGPFIQGIAQALAVHVARTYKIDAERLRGGLQAFKLHRVFAAMRERLAQPFDLATLAGLAELSEFHFSRVQAIHGPLSHNIDDGTPRFRLCGESTLFRSNLGSSILSIMGAVTKLRRTG